MNRRKYRVLFSLLVFLVSVILFSQDNVRRQILPTNISPTMTPGKKIVTPTLSSVSPKENDNAQSSTLVQSEGGNQYRVVKVVDGDTFDVEIEGKAERLRMIGIDTPETVDPRKSVQCFGKAASDKAKELLTNKFVILEADSTQGDRDKYGRLLRYAFLPDGTNFGFYMISEGYAHEYTYRYPYKYQVEFKQAESNARQNNKGLWSLQTCSGKP